MTKLKKHKREHRRALLASLTPESICRVCGCPGSHFVPPSLREEGFFVCDPSFRRCPGCGHSVKSHNGYVHLELNEPPSCWPTSAGGRDGCSECARLPILSLFGPRPSLAFDGIKEPS